MKRKSVANYYIHSPYKADILATCNAKKNLEVINTYIAKYRLPKRSTYMFLFSIQYAVVRDYINTRFGNNHTRQWFHDLLDSQLQKALIRPPIQLESIVYLPITKAPDMPFKYLRDREIGFI